MYTDTITTIKVPIDEEFDVTPDSYYPQTPQYMYVEYYKIDADEFADILYDYLMADVKEGDIRWVDSEEFDNFCREYVVDKQYDVIRPESSQKLFDVILMNGADAVFKHMPEFKEYFIDNYECDIVEQEEDRLEQQEYEERMRYQEDSTKTLKILRELLPDVLSVETKGSEFIRPRDVKLHLKSNPSLSDDEIELLNSFGIEVEYGEQGR